MTCQAFRKITVNGSLVAAFALFLMCIGESFAADTRIWQDSTGQFSIEAELVEARETEVVLRRKDGSEAIVPMDRLSETDKNFLLKVTGGRPSSRASLEEQAGSQMLPIEAFYKDLFSSDSEDEDRFWEHVTRFFRAGSTLIDDSHKPTWVFPALFVGGGLIYAITSIWLLIACFRTSRNCGAGLILLNVLSTNVPVLDILRWIYLATVAIKTPELVRTPLVLHLMGFLAIIASSVFAISSMMPQ